MPVPLKLMGHRQNEGTSSESHDPWVATRGERNGSTWCSPSLRGLSASAPGSLRRGLRPSTADIDGFWSPTRANEWRKMPVAGLD